MTRVLQRWQRLGRIHSGQTHPSWGQTHAALPTLASRHGNELEFLFATRDENNRSSIASICVEVTGNEWKVTRPPDERVLAPGEAGSFDADGVTPGSVVCIGGEERLYYLGWSTRGEHPFQNFIGMASRRAGEVKFAKQQADPVIGQSELDPLSLGYPWVMKSGNRYVAWYGSHKSWQHGDLPMQHPVRRAVSDDGLAFAVDADFAVPLQAPPEFAVSRPTVVHVPGAGFAMWYARRDPDYAIGFAVSQDGILWHRKDQAFCFLGEPGDWENEEQTYPCVFEHDDSLYMAYCGNGYGKTGFGLAVFEGSLRINFTKLFIDH